MTGTDLLLPEDKEFLERMGWDVDISQADPSNEIFIVVHRFVLPKKYQPSEVDLLVRQPQGYPMAGMDMFWTRPDVFLSETNQKPQAADLIESYLGVLWQRWSRHTIWRANTDMLENFIRSILTEFNRP